MGIKLDEARRADVAARLQALFETEFDEPLSEFRANAVIDLVLKTVAPAIYNQAVQDVRAHPQQRLDDLDGDVYADVEI
jgi:uncharacterized protein (DUF2164 family)